MARKNSDADEAAGPGGVPHGDTNTTHFGEANRKTIRDPFEIRSDAMAGMRLYESRRHNDFCGMAIQFGDGKPEGKPSQRIIDKLKEARFHWSGAQKVWRRAMIPSNAATTRIDADRLFRELSKMIRIERGFEHSNGISE